MKTPTSEPKGLSPYVWERHSFTGMRWPRSRTTRSFLLMVPWMTLAVMAVLLFCLLGQTIVQPGQVVNLPAGATDEGVLARCPAAVVRRLVAPGREDVTVLLLEEGRYASDNPAELEALAHLSPGEELNLMIDRDISYGVALNWVERLRASGAKRINLVTVPHQEEGVQP